MRSWAALLCLVPLACSSPKKPLVPGAAGDGAGSAGAAPVAEGCSSSCETSDWPRLILGVVPPVDGSAQVEIVSAETIDATGKAWPATVGGCPQVSGFICSYSWSANPSDRSLEVVLTLEGGAKLRVEVPLAEHNFCARNVAYVEVIAGESPAFGEPRYLSPCRRLND